MTNLTKISIEQIEQNLQRAASCSIQESLGILNETKSKLDTVKSLLVLKIYFSFSISTNDPLSSVWTN